jgi:hypothetical protein
LSAYQSSGLIRTWSDVFVPRTSSFETAGRRYGSSGSSPTMSTEPSKPAARMAATALTAATPVPTTTVEYSRAVADPAIPLDLTQT